MKKKMKKIGESTEVIGDLNILSVSQSRIIGAFFAREVYVSRNIST